MSIRFIHVRRGPEKLCNGKLMPFATGGFTIAYEVGGIQDGVPTLVRYHIEPVSKKTAYNKKIGRDVTMGRLLKFGGTEFRLTDDKKIVEQVLRHAVAGLGGTVATKAL